MKTAGFFQDKFLPFLERAILDEQNVFDFDEFLDYLESNDTSKVIDFITKMKHKGDFEKVIEQAVQYLPEGIRRRLESRTWRHVGEVERLAKKLENVGRPDLARKLRA